MTLAHFFKTLFILFICTFTACTDSIISVDDTMAIKEYTDVDERLWVYFTRFEEAAAKRGNPIDLQTLKITGQIETIDNGRAVGICYHNSNQPKQLVIDKLFWKRASESRRELIVFHELGHCVLHRAHNDKTSSDGVCKSIMRSGIGGCLDFYNGDTRGQMLNELFLID